jgi:hypothetical protein
MSHACVHERLAGLAAALGAGAASVPATEGAAEGVAEGTAEGTAAYIVCDAVVALAGGALVLDDLLGRGARGGAKASRRSSFCARSWPGLRPCLYPCPCAHTQSKYARCVRLERGFQGIWYVYHVATAIHTSCIVSTHPVEHYRASPFLPVDPHSASFHTLLLRNAYEHIMYTTE